ncbi:MAG: hypothetical protein LBU32_06750 [Clostridiales bacterium]|jgi:hypothetical protein|nr:hypothetical protein [Clostridiales bacterium]
MKGSHELTPREDAIHASDSKSAPKDAAQWHAAFQYALAKELKDCADVLEFDFEVSLTTEPLRIDAVVIKNKGDSPICKNIGKIFRKRNIFEYKSPEDSFSIKDFKKSFAYAHLYEYLNDSVNRKDITVSAVLTKKPNTLLSYLNKEGYGISNPETGIYYVEGLEYPFQIIESKKLDKQENVWLNTLSTNVDPKSMLNMIEMSKDDKEGSASYIHALMLANPDSVREVIAMGSEELAKVFEEAGYMPKEKTEALLQEKEEIIQEKEEAIEALLQEKEEAIHEKEAIEALLQEKEEKEESLRKKEEVMHRLVQEIFKLKISDNDISNLLKVLRIFFTSSEQEGNYMKIQE